MIGTASCEKSGFELIELEEAVKVDGGFWLRFMKVPNANPAAAAAQAGAKGAPAKAKAPVTDEPKPIISKAWVSLEALRKPGATKTSIRLRAPLLRWACFLSGSNDHSQEQPHISMRLHL